jgi:hypothetical protein
MNNISICAFDIGIKHLSFCIINTEQKNKIIKWELINLQMEQEICIGNNKNGKKCTKPATLYHKQNSEIKYCKKHSLQYQQKILEILDVKNNEKCCECNKKSTKKINNNYYCLPHAKKIQTIFNNEQKLYNIKNNNCMKEPLYDLGKKMYEELDKYPEILETQRIVIENQPSLTNPTMKSISILLFSYFIMKNHLCVEFISPSGKLKVNEKISKEILSLCPKKNKYAVTKELGIKFTEKLICLFEDSDNLVQIINNSKKKDDLCDAFLHAFYHIHKCKKPLLTEIITTSDFTDNLKKYFDLKYNKKNKIDDNKIVLDI